jgi:hypothetical protein
MEYKEYEDKLKELKVEFEQKKERLIKEYVDANNPYTIGDKVTDHANSIIIEKIKYHISLTGIPCAVYYGAELKKDGTPKKNGNKMYVYQCNLK